MPLGCSLFGLCGFVSHVQWSVWRYILLLYFGTVVHLMYSDKVGNTYCYFSLVYVTAFIFTLILMWYSWYRKFIKSFIQGVLPGLALKIFLIVLPTILMIMSKFEGFLSISALERRAALRYYLFNFVNVFLVSIIAGSALSQLDTFLRQSPKEYVTWT